MRFVGSGASRPFLFHSMLLAGLLLAAAFPAAAAQGRTVSGRVVDTAGAPLPGVRVAILELGRTQASDSTGAFRFAAVPPGSYTLSFSRIGLAPVTRRLGEAAGVPELEIAMHETRVALAAVQVTATLGATEARESPQPTAVLEGPELRLAQGAALGETLEQVPGVRSLSMTSGIGKPVIRGMTHYRVVTLDNGQRTETQAWGHDHSPNVETATAERVEVIKGPASVLYGSDALGGVINVVAPAVPDAIDEPAFVRGRLTSGYSHNVRGGDGTLLLEGATGGFGGRGAVTLRGTGDMRTPSGILRNTNNEAVALEAAGGYRARWGAITTRYAGRDERIEIFDDPVDNPGYTGYQLIDTHRAHAEATLPLGAVRAQVSAGYEHNFRQEFAAADAPDADLGLFVRNWTGNAQLHHSRGEALSGTVGVSAMTSDFENRGTETLIPSSNTRSAAAFALQQLDRGRWRATAGARYDYRTLATDGHEGIGVPAQERAFSAITGSAGVLYRVSAPLAIVANVARGFRAPAAPDLFANGFHEGTRAFERGDPDLRVETSVNSELGLRVTRTDFSGELTGFVTRVTDYIYLRPFGTGGRAFDSLQVVQGNARLAGAEARATYQPTSLLTLHVAGDYVHGHNTTADIPLTFIPPARAVYGLRLQPPVRTGSWRSPYLSLGAETNAKQQRLDPRDTGTDGYTLVSLGGGVTRLLPRGTFTLDVQARNLLDVRYRSFMSRYKEFADGPGRSVAIKATVQR